MKKPKKFIKNILKIKEISFDVSEETKIKRNLVLTILIILLGFSAFGLWLGFLNKNVAFAFTIGFATALIIKITDWIEASKIKRR